MGKETEYTSTSDKVAGFIRKNRIPLFALMFLAAAGTLGSVLFFSIRNGMQKRAVATLEVFAKRTGDLGDLTDPAKSMEVQSLLTEITAFASGSFGYASAKAYSMTADMYASMEKWKEAEEAWVLSARKAADIYLAPLSLYNAAAAAEEQGDAGRALDYYRQSLEFAGNFPAAPRARFNIGRIQETRGNKEAAAEAYRELIEQSPSDSSWVKLAQSRMIYLEDD
jgi:tetratricopeptide (TPR) repeat protein